MTRNLLSLALLLFVILVRGSNADTEVALTPELYGWCYQGDSCEGDLHGLLPTLTTLGACGFSNGGSFLINWQNLPNPVINEYSICARITNPAIININLSASITILIRGGGITINNIIIVIPIIVVPLPCGCWGELVVNITVIWIIRIHVWFGIFGEPHIRTWTGDYYDYHGECDLVMLHAPDFGGGKGLDLHVRTKIQHDYSYIESAALRIGDDTLEVGAWGDYVLNGVAGGNLPAILGGEHEVIDKSENDKKHIYEVQLGYGDTLTLHNFKEIVSVKMACGNAICGPEIAEWFTNSTGLMGSFTNGLTIARDGTTVMMDPNVFGQEWQVLDSEPKLFQDSKREPQYPDKCRLPPQLTEKEKRRQLGAAISPEEAAQACKDWSIDQREFCVKDVLRTRSLDYAEMGEF